MLHSPATVLTGDLIVTENDYTMQGAFGEARTTFQTKLTFNLGYTQ